MINELPPADLCPAHRKVWRNYAALTYDPRHPHEWPGISVIMDNRTDHAKRAADWDHKTREVLASIERICRGGHSIHCTK